MTSATITGTHHRPQVLVIGNEGLHEEFLVWIDSPGAVVCETGTLQFALISGRQGQNPICGEVHLMHANDRPLEIGEVEIPLKDPATNVWTFENR